MLPLPEVFKRKGYIHTLVERVDCEDDRSYAIFSQVNPELDKISAYEVVKVIKQREDKMLPGGNVYTARERVPGDGAWGLDGFTIAAFGEPEESLKRARLKVQEMIEKKQKDE